MPPPLSNDLRKRIIDSKLRGDTEDTIALEKEVGKSTVTKLWFLYRSTGSYAPRPNPRGRKPALSSEELELVRAAIVGRPDITLAELIYQFGFSLSVSALSKIVRFKLGLRFKKKRYIPPNSNVRMSK
jgi:transposase